MGTNNFHYKNASKCYVVMDSYIDDETGETVYPEQCQYQDFINNFRDEPYIEVIGVTDRYELRSYNSTYLGSMGVSRPVKGCDDVQVCIHAFARDGYYEAACLDWQIEYRFNDAIEPGCENWAEDLTYYYDYNAGMAKIQAVNISKWIAKVEQDLINRMEALFEKVSTPHDKVAQFSNGETLYSKL